MTLTAPNRHSLIPLGPSVGPETLQDLKPTGPQCCSGVKTHRLESHNYDLQSRDTEETLDHMDQH